MGLKDWLKNKGATPQVPKTDEEQRLFDIFKEQKPQFASYKPEDIKFVPIDGDKERMMVYGFYAGDKLIINGQEKTIDEDEKPHLTFHPANPNDFDNRLSLLLGKFFCNGDMVSDGTIAYKYTEKWCPYRHPDDPTQWFDEYKKQVTAIVIKKEGTIDNLHIPEKFFGRMIDYVDLTGCSNITSIEHLPFNLKDAWRLIGNKLGDTSITELPDNLKSGKDVADTPHDIVAYEFKAYAAIKDIKTLPKKLAQQKERSLTNKLRIAQNRFLDFKQQTQNNISTALNAKEEIQNFIDGKDAQVQEFFIAIFEKDGQFKRVGVFTINETQYIYSGHQLTPLTRAEYRQLGNPINVEYDVNKNQAIFVIEQINSDIQNMKNTLLEKEQELQSFQREYDETIEKVATEIASDVIKEVEAGREEILARRKSIIEGPSVADTVLNPEEPPKGNNTSEINTSEGNTSKITPHTVDDKEDVDDR